MHFMTDRSPTLLFNFQTRNIERVFFEEARLGEAPTRERGLARPSKSKRDDWKAVPFCAAYAPERGFINRRLNIYRTAKSATTSRMPLDCPWIKRTSASGLVKSSGSRR
jgi:hypothetical protein